MSRRTWPCLRVFQPRRLGVVMILAGLLVGLLTSVVGAQTDGDGPIVDVIQVDGVIDQTIADFVRDTVAKSNADGAELIAIELNTPGGLNVSTEDIVHTITASEVPVLTYVGPAGARAAGVGTYIAYASHILAASPVTQMGAATPVDLSGDELDARARNEAAAELASLAALRGRNLDFAERAVTDGQVIAILPEGQQPQDVDPDALAGGVIDGTDPRDVLLLPPEEAVDGGFVNIVEPSLSATLDRLSGYEVQVEGADGDAEMVTLTLDDLNASVRFNNLGLVRQILHTVANPTLAYLLFMGGVLAMLFEVFQPGFGVAGVSGIAMFGFGLYGLSVLPVNWLAFGLVVLGLVLLALDLAVGGLGALTGGGVLALGVGSFLLFSGPDILQVSLWVIGLVVLFDVIFFVVIMTTVLRAQGQQAMTGAEGLIGKTGVVRSMLNPEGHVFVEGALWRARAPEEFGKVRTGTPVRVVHLNDQLTLEVELVDHEAPVP
ncbi:MAG: hypothetical protein GEU81_16040 [Nitriliruptorales bacterium]|nr:hypothetical protein [Nitriliruptorales bacterium]